MMVSSSTRSRSSSSNSTRKYGMGKSAGVSTSKVRKVKDRHSKKKLGKELESTLERRKSRDLKKTNSGRRGLKKSRLSGSQLQTHKPRKGPQFTYGHIAFSLFILAVAGLYFSEDLVTTDLVGFAFTRLDGGPSVHDFAVFSLEADERRDMALRIDPHGSAQFDITARSPLITLSFGGTGGQEIRLENVDGVETINDLTSFVGDSCDETNLGDGMIENIEEVCVLPVTIYTAETTSFVISNFEVYSESGELSNAHEDSPSLTFLEFTGGDAKHLRLRIPFSTLHSEGDDSLNLFSASGQLTFSVDGDDIYRSTASKMSVLVEDFASLLVPYCPSDMEEGDVCDVLVSIFSDSQGVAAIETTGFEWDFLLSDNPLTDGPDPDPSPSPEGSSSPSPSPFATPETSPSPTPNPDPSPSASPSPTPEDTPLDESDFVVPDVSDSAVFNLPANFPRTIKILLPPLKSIHLDISANSPLVIFASAAGDKTLEVRNVYDTTTVENFASVIGSDCYELFARGENCEFTFTVHSRETTPLSLSNFRIYSDAGDLVNEDVSDGITYFDLLPLETKRFYVTVPSSFSSDDFSISSNTDGLTFTINDESRYTFDGGTYNGPSGELLSVLLSYCVESFALGVECIIAIDVTSEQGGATSMQSKDLVWRYPVAENKELDPSAFAPNPSSDPSPTPSASPSADPSASPSASASASPDPSASPSAEPSASADPSASSDPSASPSSDPSASPSVDPSASPSVDPSASPSASPTASVSPNPSPSADPSASPSATSSPGDSTDDLEGVDIAVTFDAEPTLEGTSTLVVDVSNEGTVDADRFNITLYVDGSHVNDYEVASLASGEHIMAPFVWEVNPGVNVLTAATNYPGDINTGNNNASDTVEGVEHINLTLTIQNSTGSFLPRLVQIHDFLQQVDSQIRIEVPDRNGSVSIEALGLLLNFTNSGLQDNLTLVTDAYVLNETRGPVLYYIVNTLNTDWGYESLTLRGDVHSTDYDPAHFEMYLCESWDFSSGACSSGLIRRDDVEFVSSRLNNYEFSLLASPFQAFIIGLSNLDGDNYPDYLDDDDDNDGIADSADRLVGDLDDVITNFADLRIKIGGSTSLHREFEGGKLVQFFDGNDLKAEFMVNFTTDIFDLSKISIFTQDSSTTHGAVLFRGLDRDVVSNKTLYVDKISTSNEICVIDSDVYSFSDMSDSCDGEDELLIRCPGGSSGVNCTIVSDNFKVDPLNHSYVRQFSTCREDWKCTNYGNCANGLRTRSCTDQNSCGTFEDMPPENASCVSRRRRGSSSNRYTVTGSVFNLGPLTTSVQEVRMHRTDRVQFAMERQSYTLEIIGRGTGFLDVLINPGFGSAVLNLGDESILDLDRDGDNDFGITLIRSATTSTLELRKILESGRSTTPAANRRSIFDTLEDEGGSDDLTDTVDVIDTAEDEYIDEELPVEEDTSYIVWILLILVMIAFVAVIYFINRGMQEHKLNTSHHDVLSLFIQDLLVKEYQPKEVVKILVGRGWKKRDIVYLLKKSLKDRHYEKMDSLVTYVNEALEHGLTRREIILELRDKGWSDDMITAAFAGAEALRKFIK